MKKLIKERLGLRDRTGLVDIAKKLGLENFSKLTREDLKSKIISEGNSKELQELLGINKSDIVKAYLPWLAIPAFLFGAYNFFPNLFSTSESKIQKKVENLCEFDSEYFNILIMPLRELSDCKHKDCDPSLSIYYGLVEKIEQENLPICVNYVTEEPDPITYKKGRQVAKRFNADLVLWGSMYESCVNDKSEANLKYVLTDSLGPYFDLQGESGFKRLNNIEDVRQGCLLQEAEYIINWVFGVQAFEQKDYGRALTFFKQIEDEYYSPTNDLRLKMAICYHALALYSEEGKNYYKNIKIDSSGNSISIQAAKTFQQLKDYRTALTYYAQGIKEDSTVPDYYNARARVYGMLGFKDSAVLDFRKAIQVDPKFKHAWYNLGRHFYLEGQLDTAIYYINGALEIDPHFYGPIIMKGIYYELFKKEYDSALAINRLATHVNPEEALGFENMARIYNIKAKKDTSNKQYLDSARFYFDRTLELNPKDLSSVYLNMCNFYAYFEYNFQLDSAVKYLENSLSLDLNKCQNFAGWTKFDSLMTYDTIAYVYFQYCDSSVQK
ncbi:MAG: tetratricopeptide repeat protein [Bacteroidota bacterium]